MMNKGKKRPAIILVVMLSLLAGSCVTPYEADTEEEPDLISIEGSLIKGDAEQRVTITRTTSLHRPMFLSVPGCQVTVIDELDNSHEFREIEDGVHTAFIPDEQLVIGRHYKLRVITPAAEVYESDYEPLNGGIEVDSVYHEVEQRVDATTGEQYSGVQFFLDLKAAESESRYFRWRLEETFEFTSFGPISYFYMDESLTPVYPADSWAVYRCWKSEEVEGLYLSSTLNLTVNEKKKIRLNFVSDRTEQLRVLYRLQVSQYSLSEDAYHYFEYNRIAAQESGGLYTSQPRQPLTNIQNTGDDTERVLGYFWVSTRTTKQIFLETPEGMEVDPEYCHYAEFSPMEDGEGPFPVYIYEDLERGIKYTSKLYCFDCTMRGGVNVKPGNWR